MQSSCKWAPDHKMYIPIRQPNACYTPICRTWLYQGVQEQCIVHISYSMGRFANLWECFCLRDQTCLIPIITWCRHFFHSNQYSAHEKQFKVWIESNRSLRCHVTTCEIELRQTGVICYPWRQRSWSCGMFQSWISDAHCPFQWKWQVLHNNDISVLQQVDMFFDGIACLMKVWPLFKWEFPRVPRTWRSARARANFKCDVADVNK